MCHVAVYPVLAERFVCRVLRRADLVRPAHQRLPLDAESALSALEAVHPGSSFSGVLNRIYGVDLTGFDRIAVIRRLDASTTFTHDAAYRRDVIEALGRQALERSGVIAMRPTPGALTAHHRPSQTSGLERDDLMLQCYLFGSAGFAQLCHHALERPVPLLLQPWCADRGLLPPRFQPREPFSRTLSVERLEKGFVLLDNAAAAAAVRLS